MSSVPLSYNQYAAQALWGNSSSSGSSSLLSIIKSNMLDKANSLNKSLISRYESYSSELTNKISYLDNLKSQLATLSTKAQNLTELKNRVNANINVSQGSSSLVTITNDFIIKGQAAKPAGVTSKNTSAVSVSNYEGTFEAGDYAISVTGNAVYAQSYIESENIKFSASELGSQKISELAGYSIQNIGETVTVQVGNSASTIDVNKDTTVNDFLELLSRIDGIENASIDLSGNLNGNISIKMDTSLGYQSLSFSSSNESGGSVIDVLGLTSATSALSNGTIDTLNFQGFSTNFEEVGMTGNFNLAFENSTNVYRSSVNTTIGGENTYGDEITGTSKYASDSSSLQSTTIVNQNAIKVEASLYSFTNTYYQSQLHTSLDLTQSDIDSSISTHYDMSNYTMEVTLNEGQLGEELSRGTTYSYIDKSGVTYSYTVQNRETISTVLDELGLLTDDNKVNITNIEGNSINNAFLTDLLGVDFTTPTNSPQVTITFEAKTGSDAPPQISNALSDYSFASDPSQKSIKGDIVINIDGVDTSFTIDENTTVQEFKDFMGGLGFTYDASTKNFVGGPSGSNIRVSGSSSITSIINPVVSEYQFQVGIEDDGAGNYYKNLSTLGLTENDTILINGQSIDIEQNWSINDLCNAINNADVGVESSYNAEGNTINITRTDGYLSYIDFRAVEDNSQSLLATLGFITSSTGSYSIYEGNQYLPDSVSITVTKDGYTYDIGNITRSDVVNNGVSFSTIVKNMSANDSNVMLGSFNIDINKLGEHIVTVNEATAAVPDITVSNLSGATNIIEMIEKTGTLSSNNYNLEITKISDTKMQISGTDNNGNAIETQTISKNATDNKFYYTITQYDENGDEKGSVTFEVKNDDDFAIGDTRTTNIKIEATTSEGGSLEGIEDVINSVNAQIDENNKKIINEFVNAYNDVAKEVSKINKLSSSSTSYSDKLAISELMQSFNNIINQVDTTYGSTIGLTFSYDSSLNTSILKLDTDKFLSALDTNTETVTNYLSKVSEQITSSIDLFVKSKFASIYSSSNSKLDEYNNKISSLKAKNDEIMAKLEADYKIIEQLFNQSSNQYSELFAALS